MKRYMPYVFLLALFTMACKKNDVYQYNSETDNIYLLYQDQNGNKDTTTISYSFATSPGLSQDTIWVPVSIAGKRVSRDRQFVVAVVDSLTSATPDLHYEALKPFYIMPADSGKIKVPLIIKNQDPELSNKSVKVTLRVE
ncbi:MAG: DUF4843 domain-containing protein, partial [Pedobacter sp.]